MKKAKPALKSKEASEIEEELEAASEGLPIWVDVPSNSDYPYGRQKFWSKCFDMLTIYKGNTGHTQIPFTRLPLSHPLSVLYAFVTEMRRQKRKKNNGQPNLLSDEQESLLDLLGFEWTSNFELEESDDDGSIDGEEEEYNQEEPEDEAEEEDEDVLGPDGNAWKVYKPAVAAVKEVIQPSLVELVKEFDSENSQEAEEESPKEMDYDSDGSGDSLVF